MTAHPQSGSRNRTCNLRPMKPTRYRCAIPLTVRYVEGPAARSVAYAATYSESLYVQE